MKNMKELDSADKITKIKSISDFHKELQIEKPKHPLITVIHENNKNIRRDYGAQIYNIDFYFIAVKEGRFSNLGYGKNSFDFNNGTMVFLSPNQIIAPGKKSYNASAKGWTLAFHPDLIRNSKFAEKIANYSFFSYDINEALHLSKMEMENLTGLINNIESESNSKIDRYSQHLIINNIQLLLDYCVRYYDCQFSIKGNSNIDFISRFERSLKQFYKSKKHLELGIPKVSYFGNELNMSSHYLSDLLKKETGKSAKEHIYYYIIEKAKNQLMNSNNSISEIAYDLGFQYPQHFTKLFKNKTGETPSTYRELAADMPTKIAIQTI